MLRRILIADSQKTNRDTLRKMLCEEYEILEAENGDHAIEVLLHAQDTISAVLLDLTLPVTDGCEVLSRIRKHPDLSHIPVIITASNKPDAERRALALGANDFVVKPYRATHIRHKLRNTIHLLETTAHAKTIRRDQLTGLYNREVFFAKVTELTTAQAPGYYILACFDINGFKVINDQYGIEKGDEILRQLGLIFRTGIEPLGGICGRIMADLFAMLYPASLVDAPELLEMYRAATQLDGSIPPISFSIGRYLVNDLSLSASTMFDRAALAEASIKARFDVRIAWYHESMRERILREQEMINEMTPALEAGQFEFYLQPQYNHVSGALIGAEALVRWLHPRHGVVLPGSFIPVFERNGFIYKMDQYVWKQACRLLRAWMNKRISPLPLSVNVSRYDLFQDDFFDVLTGLIAHYRIPPNLLRLEITESAFVMDPRQIVCAVERLSNYGFIIEIDDFGSGYSSLNILKDVPAQVLKLDMRFLAGNGNTTRGGNIVESVVRMARWLGMSIVAEGVETSAQADYLRSIGCFYMQGNLYAAPMPVAEFEALCARSSTETRQRDLRSAAQLDNTALWNPTSLDSLIFNNYAGGACIFEFHDGQPELLRINGRYVEELGGGALTMQTALSVNPWKLMDQISREASLQSIEQALQTGQESTCEVSLFDLPGIPGRRDLQMRSHVIVRANTRSLIFTAVANITVRREAERRARELADQLRLLNETARELMVHGDVGVGVQSLLRRVLNYFGGGRAYVLEEQPSGFSCTYEVSAPGVPHIRLNTQTIPREQAACYFHLFERPVYLSAETVGAQTEISPELQLLRAQDVQALILIPLRRGDDQIGLLLVDNPERSWERIDLLCAIGDYLAVFLMRKCLNLRMDESDHAQLSKQSAAPTAITETSLSVSGDALRIREEEYRLAIEHSGMHTYRYIHADNTVVLPKKTATLLGLPLQVQNIPEAIIQDELISRECEETYRTFFAAIRRGDRTGSMTILRKIANGDSRWLAENFCTVYGEDGTPVSSIVIFEDVTEAHEQELAYCRYLQTIDQHGSHEAALAYLEADVTANVTEKLGGKVFSAKSLSIDRRWETCVEQLALIYLPQKDQAHCREFFSREHLITVFSDGVRSLREDWQLARQTNGQAFYIQTEVQMVRDPYTGHVKAYTSVHDITQTKLAAQSAKQAAEIDGITGLYNKITVERLIRARLAATGGERCALLVADLDNLKRINDTLGHALGDEAIQALSAQLRTHFQPNNLVGRIGGDEFIIWMEDGADEARIHRVVGAFMRELSTVRIGTKHGIALHCSIGISIGTIGADAYEPLFHRADTALYHVKRNGKADFAFYTPDMEHAAYRYTGNDEAAAWRTISFDNDELSRLIEAISVMYPMVASVNLTCNSYFMMQYDNYANLRCPGAGCYDDLVASFSQTFHPDDRATFRAAFSRESLLAAHGRGECLVTHEGRQLGGDGIYRKMRTDVTFVHPNADGDVLQITFSRELPPDGQ